MVIRFAILLFSLLLFVGCSEPYPEPHNVSSTDNGTEFALKTTIVDGRMAFVGLGGDIDGIANPDLVVSAGSVVHVTLINGDGMPHDLSVTDFGVKTPLLNSKDTSAKLNFTVGEDQEGTYTYFCSVPGHRQAGMEGKLVVRPAIQNMPAIGS